MEAVYLFVFMDASHYKVKEDHLYVAKAAYVVLGITMVEHKDILGMWIGEHEGSKFWRNVINDLYKDFYFKYGRQSHRLPAVQNK